MVGNNILVTGGAGYIGSHTVLQLLLGGYNTLVIDNFDNSSLVSINRVKELAGYHGQYLTFHQMDLCNKPALEKVFSESEFDAVMHFDAVGESMADNLMGAIILLEVMSAHGCKKLVFSSSSTPKEVPCTEESPLSEMTPYGPTQRFNEDICCDVQRGDPEWRIMMLMYFNPVGAQPSGHIGEDPFGTPNNLIMPYVQQVVIRRMHKQKICGTDYTTKDGTGVRDYLQVVDLADGHICALQKLDDTEIGCEVYNLRTVKGTTVLEMVDASEKTSGMCAQKIPLVRVGRRPGDPIKGDGVSGKSVVSGIQCLDLPIEADDVSEKSEGALHKLSAYLLKQKELELSFSGRLMSSDYFPGELELVDLEFMESVVDILESHVLFLERHGTEVKEKLLEAKKLISDAKDYLKKAKKKLKEDKKEQEMN